MEDKNNFQANSSRYPRQELRAGKGSDPDTLGHRHVWVYDTRKFPFSQAELDHQFHDDIWEDYPDEYNALKDVAYENGRIRSTNCVPMIGGLAMFAMIIGFCVCGLPLMIFCAALLVKVHDRITGHAPAGGPSLLGVFGRRKSAAASAAGGKEPSANAPEPEKIPEVTINVVPSSASDDSSTKAPSSDGAAGA